MCENFDSIYIPLGFQCTTAEILKKMNKRFSSFPFDWIISTPYSILKLLDILLKNECNINDFVLNEFFNFDTNLIFMKQEEFQTHSQGNILYNSKYNLIFPHIKYNDETVLKFKRRFERLRNYILDNNVKIQFFFINRIINNDVIEVNENNLKYSINNNNIYLNIKENFIKLKNLLLNYMNENRFKIIIINAVDKINDNIILDKNIIYHEIIPLNNSHLTDEEILQIQI